MDIFLYMIYYTKINICMKKYHFHHIRKKIQKNHLLSQKKPNHS